MRGSLRSLVPAIRKPWTGSGAAVFQEERRNIALQAAAYWKRSVLFMGAVADDRRLGLDMAMVNGVTMLVEAARG